MKIELVKPDKLIPYDKNPRKNDSAIRVIKNSIKEFGFRQPIVVDENMVILVGHTRCRAAMELGIDAVPVHKAIGLSDIQKKAYRIMDNKSQEYSQWDYDLLKLEIGELPQDFKELTGFEEDDLKFLESQDWISDIDPLNQDGSTLDGISSKIILEIAPEHKEEALGMIKEILKINNIEYTLK